MTLSTCTRGYAKVSHGALPFNPHSDTLVLILQMRELTQICTAIEKWQQDLNLGGITPRGERDIVP